MINTPKYTSSQIEILTGLKGIIHRPGMYTSTENPTGLIQEIIDNAIDESSACGLSSIEVRYESATGFITVGDSGRGIPIDIKEGFKESTLRLVCETLHSGGKFYTGGSSGYNTTAGLHGVGLCVVNALSSCFYVQSRRDGQQVSVMYHDGVLQNESRLPQDGTSTGTTVRFCPNPSHFTRGISKDDLLALLQRRSAVTSIRIEYTVDGVTQSIKEDLVGYVCRTFWGASPRYVPFSFSHSIGNLSPIHVEGVIVIPAPKQKVMLPVSFYNSIYTPNGGDHINAVSMALREALVPYYSSTKIQTDMLLPEDEEFPMMISVSVPGTYQVRLSGQTKTAVVSSALYSLWEPLLDILKGHFSRHKDDLLPFLTAIESRIHKREQIKAAERAINLPQKLPPPAENVYIKPRRMDPNVTEIFLIEGASAKIPVDRKFQGCIMLKGMVDNAYKATGIHPGLAYILQEAANINKLIILTDADPSGYGIATALACTIWKRAPELFHHGKVYAIRPPLFKVTNNKKVTYYHDDVPSGEGNVVRFKGIGAMDASDVKICIGPDTRKLMQLRIESAEAMNAFMSLAFSEDVEARREWLG